MAKIESYQSNQTKIADKILDILFEYRRQLNDQVVCDKLNCQRCRQIHNDKIISALAQNKALELILPAFPAKSANRDKTINDLPDLGEKLSLQFLNDICNKIKRLYSPGAQIIICSDGRVFNDLVKVTDKDVEKYNQAISNIIKHENLTNLSLFSLDDCYINSNYEEMRENLIDSFAESIEHLKIRTRNQQQSKALFNGIHRFIYEDQLFFFPDESKNKVRKRSKEIAYAVIQRSNAWSCLLKEKFPDSLRLSIHPQLCGSEKLGICLLESNNPWATPWHNVVLQANDKYYLVKQSVAKQMGGVLMESKYSNHYRVPN